MCQGSDTVVGPIAVKDGDCPLLRVIGRARVSVFTVMGWVVRRTMANVFT